MLTSLLDHLSNRSVIHQAAFDAVFSCKMARMSALGVEEALLKPLRISTSIFCSDPQTSGRIDEHFLESNHKLIDTPESVQ
jgi:hypothetical protein